MDADAASFVLDVNDLSSLLGKIVRQAKRRIHTKDIEYFQLWLHVISDPVVVKVNAGDTAIER